MTFSTIASLGVSLQGGGGSGGGGAASLPISGNGATITASTPLVDGTQTWNNAAVTFTGLKFNATNTASAAASLLMDLQVGGASRFNIGKDGNVNVRGIDPQLRLGYLNESQFIINQGLVVLGRNFQLAFSSSSNGVTTINQDTILTRRAAANFRFGAADAAAALAQTLSVQSVVAGTTNIAGANLTITGSQGTGTGAGGSIIFQVAPAGSSGTAQNALADALTIDSTKLATFADAVRTSAPSGGTAANWKLGTVASVTPTLQNRTIEVDIGGTIYYISAKTTND